jgi:transposase
MVLILHSREEFDHLVVLAHAEGVSIRALARRFGCSRNTIRAILKKHKARRDEGPDGPATQRKRLPKESKLDAYLPKIRQTLEAFPDITGQRLFEILKEQGYDGGISILRERLQTLRPKPKCEPIVRFETEPGEQGQMDWSPYAIPFTRTGKGQVLCFSYILGYSRRQYIDFTARRDFFTLIRRHVDAFEHFRGVPRQCLYDSEKTVVLRWEAGKPVFNPAFVAFITHYECKPIACRRGRAQTKGKVERPFQYVESNFLNGRTFQDVEDLRATARWWLGERCDRHRHETTGRPPIELFEEDERQALTPLPLHPYDAAEVALRVCDGEGFLDFETNRYSVPYAYLFDILTLKATEHEVFVYSPQLDLIARHERLPAGARQPVEIASHHAATKIRYGLEPVREAFLALGEGAQIFLDGLKDLRNAGFHARSILKLKECFHTEDIHRALLHASRYHAYDAKAIERILAAHATPRTLESIRNQRAREELGTCLPRIEQRSLAEYSDLWIPKDAQENPDAQARPQPPDRNAASTDQEPPEDAQAHEDGRTTR